MRTRAERGRIAVLFLIGYSLLFIGCTEKESVAPETIGAIAGMVYPADSGARVAAKQGIEIGYDVIDTTGYYRIESLPVGVYILEVTAHGYATYVEGDITVYGGGTTAVDNITLSAVPGLVSSTYPNDGERDVAPSPWDLVPGALRAIASLFH